MFYTDDTDAAFQTSPESPLLFVLLHRLFRQQTCDDTDTGCALFQTSPESPLVFVLLHRLFRQQTCEELKAVALEKCSFSEDDWKVSQAASLRGYGWRYES